MKEVIVRYSDSRVLTLLKARFFNFSISEADQSGKPKKKVAFTVLHVESEGYSSIEMRQMNDKVFVDNNVLVYAHTDPDQAKQSVAQI